MPDDEESLETARQRAWAILYASLERTLATHGRNDPFGEGEYFLIDDDFGTYQHKIECSKASFFRSGALTDTQRLLSQYDGPWQIVFVLSRDAGGPAACTVTRDAITHQVNYNEE